VSGICGAVRYDGKPVTLEFLKAIAEKAPYRAGNGFDAWIHGAVGLGYLSSQASSPKSAGLSLGQRWVVVADARLDNRADLLRLLEAKDCLRSESPSDVDLVQAAFVCWGVGCCERLQGAYSIACWDRAKSCLILVRDRLGERPVYWASTVFGLFFASEPAQLLAEGMLDPAPNLERALAYLTKQPFDPTWSFFRAIQRLPEGHFLLAQDGRVTLQRYWSLDASAVQGLGQAEAADRLSHCLEQAVARRLAGHGQAGVLLSGGLDSSSIAAKASALLELRAEQLHAFTWESHSGDKLDERQWSATLIGARPNIVEHPVPADPYYPLSRYPEAYADPNAPDTNTYPDLLLTTIQVAQKQGVDLIMNGIGGDPALGGILPELALLRQKRWGMLAQRLRRSGLRSFRVLAGQLRAAFKTDLPAWLSSQGRRLAHQAGLDGPAPWTRELKSPLQLRAFLLTQPSNGMALERFDRLSARHGVRIAAPWCDLDLVLLPLSVEDGALDQQPPGKSLLRQAMAGELPEKLLADPVPKVSGSRLVAEGLVRHERDRIESWLQHSILGQLGLVDSSILLATYQQFAQSGRVMPGIWEIITLEIWLKLNYNKVSQGYGEQYQALPIEKRRR
jgi:asparagine synthase (glutamine-hydrolysing)